MEITCNDEYTDASLEHRIISITEGLDFMNKTFGTNITVRKEMKNDDIQRNLMDYRHRLKELGLDGKPLDIFTHEVYKLVKARG